MATELMEDTGIMASDRVRRLYRGVTSGDMWDLDPGSALTRDKVAFAGRGQTDRNRVVIVIDGMRQEISPRRAREFFGVPVKRRNER